MRKVMYAQFHQTLFLKGVGEIQRSLPNESKSFRKLEMWAGVAGLEINVNGVEALIPWPNVVIAQFAPDESEKAAFGTVVPMEAKKPAASGK